MLYYKSLNFCGHIPDKPRRHNETCTKNKKKNIFPKKTEKGKKEKESSFTGRDADRPKGNGISPEGWLGSKRARHYAVVFWTG